MLSRFAPVVALALLGCGANSSAAPSLDCSSSPISLEHALRSAPAPVLLADGTKLSACVERAQSDGQLQDVGRALSSTAEELASQAANDSSAAVQLGYLLGAARRGAARTNGVAAELVRRLEQAARSVPPGPLDTGLRAGERSG